MTFKILVPSVLALFIAGCTTDGGALPGGTSGAGTATNRVPTAGALRVRGDIVPSRLVSVAIPAPTEFDTLHGSDALAPKKPFSMETPALPVTGRDLHLVMTGDPANFTMPVDAPNGARIIVHPVDPDVALPTVHLVDVATGVRLDMARDETNGVNTAHIPIGQSDPGMSVGKPVAPEPGEETIVRDARGNPAPVANGALQREPGFQPLLNHTRVLSIDHPFASGVVRVEVPANVAAGGIVVELQQPNTHFTITARADQPNYSFGDVATITATLAQDSASIAGKVDGTVELPNHTKSPILQFSPAGNGTYVATLPLASADPKYIGVWGLHLHATGSVGGVRFERDVETAIGYYPAHAQMTGVGTPVVSRGADGLIDSVSVDVDVDTLVDDRFGLRGTLTYTGADGSEHPLALAQTGQLIIAGKGTMTLTFDNASMALARVNGPFHLRDLALVSQGFGLTQHRLGRALDLATPAIAAHEIRFPATISLQAEDLIANGDLAPLKP